MTEKGYKNFVYLMRVIFASLGSVIIAICFEKPFLALGINLCFSSLIIREKELND